MDVQKTDKRMEGWLCLIRCNRFGLQFARKRYFILEKHCLKSFKSIPSSDTQEPLRSAIVDSCIRVTDNGRENCNRKVFFIFTLYNTSNHNDSLKLGASSPEEAAKWIQSLQDVAMEAGANLKGKWQPFRLNGSKSATHTQSGTSDVIAPSQWKIFGCQNGLRLFKEARDDNSGDRNSGGFPTIMAVGMVEGTSEAIFRTLMSLGPSRAEWDFCFYRGTVVEHLDGHTDIVNMQLYRDWLPWGMKRRDLLLQRYWRREDDGTYDILYHSVIHNKCPPHEGYVRATIQSGGFVVSPVNQGKESIVKHMLSVDWKLWNSYFPKTSDRSLTIRMLGRVSALRELFRAKAGELCSPELLSSELGSFNTDQHQHSEPEPGAEAETDQINSGDDKKSHSEDSGDDKKAHSEDAPVSASSNLTGLDDAADEFYDIPQPSNEEQDEPSSPEQGYVENTLSSAAGFVKKLHELAVQKKDSQETSSESNESCCYGSTFQKDSNCNLPCTWTSADPSLFLIRGENYLKDQRKHKAKHTLMQLVAADWLNSDKREDDLASRPGGIVEKHAAQGGPEFFFVINMQVPGTTTYNLALYYMTKTPLESSPLLQNFVNGDDSFRNSRLKLIPYISEGSWIVKQSVGKKACLVGQALEVNYFHGKNYLEVDVDVGSSTVARGVVNLVLGYLNNLVVEMAFLIQANTQEELPEALLGTCRLNHMDAAKSVPVDSLNV